MFASAPTLCTTRAAIGTADTPAAPTSGLILSFVNRFISFASSRPLAVLRAKAKSPRAKMNSTSVRRKVAASMVAPTLRPRKIVAMFISAFWVVSFNRSTTFDSRNRLPSMNIAMSGAEAGTSSTMTIVAASGKISFSRVVTLRAFFILMARSFWVVRSRMIGGWIIGTSAI